MKVKTKVRGGPRSCGGGGWFPLPEIPITTTTTPTPPP